jgi:hypothetical protein
MGLDISESLNRIISDSQFVKNINSLEQFYF